jgi:hypothetical protein
VPALLAAVAEHFYYRMRQPQTGKKQLNDFLFF